MRIPMIPSLAALAFALGATSALAGESVTIQVAVSDLDLTSDADMAKLKARIADAAAEACAPADEWVLTGTSTSDCVSTLKRKAMAEVETRIAELP